MAKFRVRCNDCRSYGSLPKALHKYIIEPKCKTCGSTNIKGIEQWRQRAAAKEKTCRCSAYPFPHRRGSLRMCIRHALHGEEPTPDDIDAYRNTIETPRGYSA